MDEIKCRLNLIVNILTITNKEEIKEYILEIIPEKDEQFLYHESDGIKKTRLLEEITGVSISRISRCWEKWENLGLITKNKQNRGLKLFNLNILGIKYKE